MDACQLICPPFYALSADYLHRGPCIGHIWGFSALAHAGFSAFLHPVSVCSTRCSTLFVSQPFDMGHSYTRGNGKKVCGPSGDVAEKERIYIMGICEY
jgi:hypothetical protein